MFSANFRMIFLIKVSLMWLVLTYLLPRRTKMVMTCPTSDGPPEYRRYKPMVMTCPTSDEPQEYRRYEPIEYPIRRRKISRGLLCVRLDCLFVHI